MSRSEPNTARRVDAVGIPADGRALSYSPSIERNAPALVLKGNAMAKIREFIHAEAVFDPEAIQVLASALDDAWDRIQKSGSRFARPAYARAVREVLAKRIIEAAQRGEKDKLKLAADAVKFLGANYMDDSTGKPAAAKNGSSEADSPRPRLLRGAQLDRVRDFSKSR